MIFDTDVIIWAQRGNVGAAKLIDKEDERLISLHSYMELLQLASDKKQHQVIKKALKELDFIVLPLTQNIGHRAAVYMEEYSMGQGLRAGDAIVAATAVEDSLQLCSSNQKHFKCINDLDLKVFKPH